MNVFAYGSLMFPEVWTRVTGLTAPGMEALLTDYSVRRIRGQSYPVMAPEPGGVVKGVLYTGVPEEVSGLLDAFEGTFYERVVVGVTLADGAAVSAMVYRAADPASAAILAEAWDAACFERDGLAAFLQEDPGFSGSGAAREL
jgi:gamma-glutamylcyclotransferase (GGCT)/AIG2-like uncharacterized protein YtfP